MKSSKIVFLLCILLFINLSLSVGQVTIAPTSVFVEEQEQFGSFTVINSSDHSQEVSISFLYGYPTTDSTGNVSMFYKDSSQSPSHSVIPYVRGFPKNFVLNPGQRQSVRLAIRPEQNLDDGTYWGRIKVTSNPQTPPIEASSEEEIRAQVNFRFEQIIALFYRKGDPTTGINFNKLYTENSDSLYHLFADVQRTGNSPYHGSVALSIKREGKTILEKQNSVAVYFDFLKRFDIPFSNLEDGTMYQATITFRSQRTDIPSEHLIKTEPVSESTTFTISK